MKKRLAIIGAGELGKQILNLSLQDDKLDVFGFFDDTIHKDSVIIDNYKVVGNIADILSLYKSGKFDCIILAIGYNHMKLRSLIFNELSAQIPFAIIIHKSCIIDSTAKIGQGTVMYPGCIIDKNVTVEENILLNLGVVLSHDSLVGSHCFVAPGAVICGFVKVGEACFVGANSTIIDNISISPATFLGAGTVVIDNLNESGIYVGNPAKKIIK